MIRAGIWLSLFGYVLKEVSPALDSGRNYSAVEVPGSYVMIGLLAWCLDGSICVSEDGT